MAEPCTGRTNSLHYEPKEFIPLPHLPEATARQITWVMVLASAGSVLPLPSQVTALLGSLDPARALQSLGPLVVSLHLLATALCNRTQRGIYYAPTGSRFSGIFRFSIGALSQLEYNLDLFLMVLSTVLFPLSVYAPTMWFGAFSLYNLLVGVRCHVTLLRPRLADAFSGAGRVRFPGLICSTFPELDGPGSERLLSPEQSKVDWSLFRNSIYVAHQAGFESVTVEVRHALAGWRWAAGQNAWLNLVVFLGLLLAAQAPLSVGGRALLHTMALMLSIVMFFILGARADVATALE